MILTAAAVTLVLASSPTAPEEAAWRWQSRWALAEHFDLAVVPRAGEPGFAPEVRLGRGARGFPPGWAGSTLRVTASGLERRPRWGGAAIPLVEHRGPAGAVGGVALGGQGAWLLVDEPALGGEAVLEVRYRPAHEYPFRIGHAPRVHDERDARGHAVMAARGCFSCHSLHGRRQVGPSLDREGLVPRLAERLGSEGYRQRIAALDREEGWGVARWRTARAEVLAAEGAERLRIWMRWHLTEPAFDEPQARMPPPGLSADEIDAVTAFLLRTGASGAPTPERP